MSLGLSLRGRLLVDERLYDDQEIDQKIKEIRSLIENIKDLEKRDLVEGALNHVLQTRDDLSLDSLDVMNGLARVELLANKVINAQ